MASFGIMPLLCFYHMLHTLLSTVNPSASPCEKVMIAAPCGEDEECFETELGEGMCRYGYFFFLYKLYHRVPYTHA